MLQSLRAMVELFGPRLDPDAVLDPDPEMVRLAVAALKVAKRYFRAEVHGLERMPSGPALIVGNHNAGITSFEPFMLGLQWHLRTGGFLYFLGHDAMTALPLLGNALMRLGVIRASHAVAGRALASGKKVMVFPGGNYEAFRPFTQRHRVDFGRHVGYVRLALRSGVPIVPVLCLGGHESFFVLCRGAALARLSGARRLLRSDSFPLFLGMPWGVGVGPIFHLPLPAKLLVEVGEPLALEGYGPEAAEDRSAVEAISDRVQQQIQAMMDRRVAQRRWPVLG